MGTMALVFVSPPLVKEIGDRLIRRLEFERPLLEVTHEMVARNTEESTAASVQASADAEPQELAVLGPRPELVSSNSNANGGPTQQVLEAVAQGSLTRQPFECPQVPGSIPMCQEVVVVPTSSAAEGNAGGTVREADVLGEHQLSMHNSICPQATVYNTPQGGKGAE
jgi:hypothetical protein